MLLDEICAISMQHVTIPEWDLEPHLDAIDRCFSRGSVEEIIEALKAEGTEWANGVITQLLSRSPVALKVTYRIMRNAPKLDLGQCMHQDFVAIQRFMKERDFYTAIEYRLLQEVKEKKNADTLEVLEKGQQRRFFEVSTTGGVGGSPKWSHTNLSDVSDEEVNKYFKLDQGELPLSLPNYDDPATIYPVYVPGALFR